MAKLFSKHGLFGKVAKIGLKMATKAASKYTGVDIDSIRKKVQGQLVTKRSSPILPSGAISTIRRTRRRSRRSRSTARRRVKRTSTIRNYPGYSYHSSTRQQPRSRRTGVRSGRRITKRASVRRMSVRRMTVRSASIRTALPQPPGFIDDTITISATWPKDMLKKVEFK